MDAARRAVMTDGGEGGETVLRNLNAADIQKYQRNRYPVLLIDKVVEAVPGRYCIAEKYLSYNEWYFPAHFDDDPNVPGFVQMEFLAQTFIMTFLTFPEHMGKKTAFVKADGVTFKRKLVPGERLRIRATLDSFRHGVAKGHVVSDVDGEEACSARFVIALPDILHENTPETE